ncbi:SET domain-containing protein [Sodiomyces alkalinus F11]|uniref:SET domain-containing protein n=1 Tax=Sodiomyces alkalinus (strain CBS 110278 / VKM F-3762 / F11) TaxID=1314773 RepID=A0A3N2PPJ8_SODAK|nr:SET domain-containing protein [Sodiomyces alkalinus F11]ROT36360.1 SET domain-containing protein [Sodiomyces alkalinus F11]
MGLRSRTQVSLLCGSLNVDALLHPFSSIKTPSEVDDTMDSVLPLHHKPQHLDLRSWVNTVSQENVLAVSLSEMPTISEAGSQYSDMRNNSKSNGSSSNINTMFAGQHEWEDIGMSRLTLQSQLTGPTTPDTDSEIPQESSMDPFKPQPIVHTMLGPARLTIGLSPRPSLLSTIEPDGCLFANDFFEIRNSPGKGWGAFAVRDLFKGDHILMEQAVIHAYDCNLMEVFNGLDDVERQIVLDLHAYKPAANSSLEARVLSAWHTNNFACPGDGRGDGLFPVASRFNHACHPKCNVKYCYDRNAKVMVFTVSAVVVKAGEELTITYGKDPDILKEKYGFDCCCGGCEGAYRSFLAREYGVVRW